MKVENRLKIFFEKLSTCTIKNPVYSQEFLKKLYNEIYALSKIQKQQKNKMPSSSESFSSDEKDYKEENEKNLNKFLAKEIERYVIAEYNPNKYEFGIYKHKLHEIMNIIPSIDLVEWFENSKESEDLSQVAELKKNILEIFQNYAKSLSLIYDTHNSGCYKPANNGLSINEIKNTNQIFLNKHEISDDENISMLNTIKFYTDKYNGCPPMQGLLRNYYPTEEIKEQVNLGTLIQLIYINLLIENYSKSSQELYQVRSENDFNLKNYQESKEYGNAVALKGFVSVTGSALDEFQNNTVCLVLKIPSNAKALTIRDLSFVSEENETLLPSNTKIKVLRIIDFEMNGVKKHVVFAEVESNKLSELTQIDSLSYTSLNYEMLAAGDVYVDVE